MAAIKPFTQLNISSRELIDVWLKLEVVNGCASESLRGRQIPHYRVNIDNDDDVVRGHLLKCRGLQGSLCVCACCMNASLSVGVCNVRILWCVDELWSEVE